MTLQSSVNGTGRSRAGQPMPGIELNIKDKIPPPSLTVEINLTPPLVSLGDSARLYCECLTLSFQLLRHLFKDIHLSYRHCQLHNEIKSQVASSINFPFRKALDNWPLDQHYLASWALIPTLKFTSKWWTYGVGIGTSASALIKAEAKVRVLSLRPNSPHGSDCARVPFSNCEYQILILQVPW